MTPWTVAHQSPLSMRFSRQEYWSRLSVPSPRGLPNPGTEPMSPALAGIFFTTEPPGKLPNTIGTNRDLVTKKDFVRCHGGKEGGLDLILMVEEEKLNIKGEGIFM